MNEKNRVVITGMGAVTPIGNNVIDTWQGIKDGKCGIDKITLFDTTDHKVHLAAEVKDLNEEDYLDKKCEIRKIYNLREEVEFEDMFISNFDNYILS